MTKNNQRQRVPIKHAFQTDVSLLETLHKILYSLIDILYFNYQAMKQGYDVFCKKISVDLGLIYFPRQNLHVFHKRNFDALYQESFEKLLETSRRCSSNSEIKLSFLSTAEQITCRSPSSVNLQLFPSTLMTSLTLKQLLQFTVFICILVHGTIFTQATTVIKFYFS